MKKMVFLSAALCSAGLAGIASAQSITSYDITDAARSGFGGWGHTYGGTIIDTGNFLADGFAFTRANYSDGSGTLNDGSPGTGPGDSQLFANNADARPVITIRLDGTFTIDDITLFAFDSGNSIPGAIASVEVEIGGQSAVFNTTEPTTNDEFIDLSGSPLQNIPTDTIILKNFRHDGRGNGLPSMFCIGEIQANGTPGGCPSDFTATKGGTCPGSNSMSWSGAPANSSVRVLYTTNGGGGGVIPPNNPCPGTTLCIGLAGVTLHPQVLRSNGSGGGSVPSFAAPCGLHIQLITQTSCKTSNAVTL